MLVGHFYNYFSAKIFVLLSDLMSAMLGITTGWEHFILLNTELKNLAVGDWNMFLRGKKKVLMLLLMSDLKI